MAGTLVTTFAQDLLDYLCRNVAISGFTAGTMFIGLIDADPTVTGAVGSEVSGTGYGRVAIVFTSATAPGSGVCSIENNAIVNFNSGSTVGEWNGGSAIPGFAIFDAATSGNRIAAGTLDTPKTVTAGDTASFAAGDITITLT